MRNEIITTNHRTGLINNQAAHEVIEYTIIDGDDSTVANRSFGMYVVSGSTGAASATIDVFGYLFDS